jgi:ribosomal protein S18 acetylase RimI-like enzyme
MTLTLRPAVPNDFQFAFDAKRDAIGPHVVTRWGWDEQFQLEHHRKQWASKPWQVIVIDSLPIGTVSIDLQPSHMQFGEFYILNAYRSQGIGTQVLVEALKVADQKCLETRLEYLKWNPVASLYARHGFRVVGENEIHYFLIRQPNKA